MLLKSLQLNKNILQNSRQVLNSLNGLHNTKSIQLTCFNSTFSANLSLAAFTSAQRRPLLTKNILEKSVFLVNNLRVHTSAIAKQSNDGTKTPIKPSTPTKSVLSDDLKNIMAQKFGEEEQNDPLNKAKVNSNKEQSGQGEEKQGRFATMFSREHAWKVSLTFLIAMFGGSFIYILLEWGAPKLDENKQPVIDFFRII
jgi:hypothetical protein